MDTNQYLQMIDAQLSEAKEHMESMHKSFLESKARYDALRSSKDSFIEWVVGEKGEQ